MSSSTGATEENYNKSTVTLINTILLRKWYRMESPGDLERKQTNKH